MLQLGIARHHASIIIATVGSIMAYITAYSDIATGWTWAGQRRMSNRGGKCQRIHRNASFFVFERKYPGHCMETISVFSLWSVKSAPFIHIQ